MFKKLIKSITILIAVLGLLFIPSTKIKAEDLSDDLYTEGEAYAESMDINITANDDYTFNVEQRIRVHMGYDEHGIYMIIPYTNESSIDIDSVSGPGDYKQVYKGKNGKHFVQLKIGDPDRYLEGTQEWVVKYTIQGYKLKDEKDFVALSVVPAFWDIPIKHIKTTITMPKAVKWNNLTMYAGSDGSKKSLLEDEHFKLVKKTNKQLIIEGKDLPDHYGASMRADLPKGYWNITINDYPLTVLLCLAFFAIVCAVVWFIFGRDIKPIETVEFYAPEGLAPAEIGYLIDGTIDDKDLISMIFYFASKGYVSIEQKGNSEVYIIRKLKSIDDAADEPRYAKILFHGLFSGTVETFTTNIPSKRFAEACNNARVSIENRHMSKESKLHDTKSLVARGILVVIGFLLLLILGAMFYINYRFVLISVGLVATGVLTIVEFFLLNSVVNKKYSLSKQERLALKIASSVVGLIICGILAFICSRPYGATFIGIMIGLVIILIDFILVCIERKNPALVEIQGRILGFRNFIELAEVDKLKALVEENPEYFYDIMPYAYVFGLSDKWVKKFENISMEAPNWYSGNGMVNMYIFATMMDSVVNTTESATSSAISSMSSSSSIGSTGGSSFSSSGGFGGGGGGTW